MGNRVNATTTRQKCDIAAAIASALADSRLTRIVDRERDDMHVDIEFEGAFWRIEITGPWTATNQHDRGSRSGRTPERESEMRNRSHNTNGNGNEKMSLTRYAVTDYETGKVWDAKARRFVRDGGTSYGCEARALAAARRAENLAANIGPIEIIKYEV